MYAAARDVARELRKTSTDSQVRSALAMLFPAESWATDDAKTFDPKKHDRVGARWFESASMLLLAVNDLAVASSLVDRWTADKSGQGTFWLAEPAFALVHRFGDRAAPMLLAALAKTRNARDDASTATVLSALSYLEGPDVAKVMETFRGKKIGQTAVARFFARSTAPTSVETSSRKVAVFADLDMFGSVAAWKKMPLRVTPGGPLGAPAAPAASVGAAIDAWQKDHGVRIRSKKGTISVRGAIGLATMWARGAELAAAFCLGEDLAAERKVHFQGQLFFYVVGAGEGVRIELYERGESSIEDIADSMDDDPAVREALG